jgi:rhodanese-related sulfurtransferase
MTKTILRVLAWAALGIISGFLLTREPAPASHNIVSNKPHQLISMGITPALEQQRSGAILIDARRISSGDLPIPGAVRNVSTHNAENRVIVIGDEVSARKLKTKFHVVGWVPAWTLKRDAYIPAQWEITTSQLQKKQQTSDIRVLDVREDYEWARSGVPGSQQVSMFRLQSELRDKKQPVAIFCETGHRSAFWVKQLRAQGFHNVLSVRGGWLDWKAQNLPLSGTDETL